jgi:hypothetical protein
MFDITITNNFIEGIGGSAFAAGPLPPNIGVRSWSIGPNGGRDTISNVSHFLFTIPGMGNLLIIDLGDRKLDAYTNDKIPWTKSTWGGLARYRGLDAYFRYEGRGKIDIVIDRHGCADLKFAQGGMVVSLADMTVS